MPEVLITAAPYFAEFMGTFMLVLTFGFWRISQEDAAWAYTAIASFYLLLVYSLEPISGAHFNPAVSLCTLLSGKGKFPTLLGYWIVQFSGGILASLCCRMMFPMEPEEKGRLFVPVNTLYLALGETIYTSMLCFVVLNVACTRANIANQFYGLAIGFVVIAGGYATRGIGIGAFNPALSIGFDICLGDMGIVHGIYCACWEFVGAAIATIQFRMVRPEEFGGDPGGVLPKCMSEFLGTLYFALTVILNLVTGSGITAWSATACLISMTYSLANMSGSNFNPAVSLGVMLSGRSKLFLVDGVSYIALQFSAGALAGLIIGICAQAGGLETDILHVTVDGDGRAIKYSMKSAFVAEFVFSVIFVFVFLAVATTRLVQARYYFGIAIGCCVTAGAVTMGNASGAALNPAVALSLCAAEFLCTPSNVHWLKTVLWIVVELAAGVVAAVLFRLLYWREYESSFFPLATENGRGAEVGSMVARNDNVGTWLAWAGSSQSAFAFDKQRSCRVCTS